MFELSSAATPWALASIVGLLVAGKLVALWLSLRGADSKDKPNIIKAVAELFRWSPPRR